MIGTCAGAAPVGKLEVRLQLSTDPAPRGVGEVALGGEALRLGIRLRDLRLHPSAEERALKAAARVRDLAQGELPGLVVKIKAFHRGRLEGQTPVQLAGSLQRSGVSGHTHRPGRQMQTRRVKEIDAHVALRCSSHDQ